MTSTVARPGLTNPAVDPSVFGRYDRDLTRYLLRRVGRPVDVDDLAQEVYLRLITRKENQPILKPLAYIYGVAAHVVADYQKARADERRHLTIESDCADVCIEEREDQTSADILVALIALQEVEHALNELPRTQATVLLAHKGCGCSYVEVAEQLGLSIHTVEKYVTQAKSKMRAMTCAVPSSSQGTRRGKKPSVQGARPVSHQRGT